MNRVKAACEVARQTTGKHYWVMAQEMGIYNGLLSQWNSGARMPSMRSRRTLGDYFGLHPDELVGESDEDFVKKLYELYKEPDVVSA